jgi:large subunit ribosomal protein L33
MRELFTMECTGCGNRNYNYYKDKKKSKERIVLKKFCKSCRSHTEHKEKK